MAAHVHRAWRCDGGGADGIGVVAGVFSDGATGNVKRIQQQAFTIALASDWTQYGFR